MPRIPDELIERIKAEVPVKALAERAGVTFTAHGENLTGLCVFHPDRKTPNLVLTPAKNVFHCFACGVAGSPIDWVMRMEGVKVRAAIEILLLEYFPAEARRLGIGVPPKRSTVPKLPSPFEPEASREEIARAVVTYYHEKLKETPDAMTFLQRRGLDTPEVIEGLQLGFSDRTLGLRLPLMNRKAGQEIRTKLQELGVYRPSGHEHLVGCLVVPFFDEAGEVRSLYGRRIDAHTAASMPRHLYTAGPHEGLLNRAAFESKEVILCEAPLDAATFYRWGFRNVTTSYGVEGFTDELFTAFVSHGVSRCFIAYDRDEAGDRGAQKAATRLMAAGVECYRVFFPRGMDANEYALKVAPGDKSLDALLRGAEWMGSPRPPHGTRPDEGAEAPAAQGEPAAGEHETKGVAVAGDAPEPGRATKKDASGAAKEENTGAGAPSWSDQAKPGAPQTPRNGTPRNGTHVPALARLAAGLVPPSCVTSAPSSSVPSPATPAPPSALTKLTDDEAEFAFEDRRYRVRNLRKCLAFGSLRVNLRAERIAPELFAPPSPLEGRHMDTLDLCLHKQRAVFEKQAAHEMGVREEVVHKDIGTLVRILEDVQEKRIAEATAPKQKTVVLTEGEIAEALAFWKSPDLMRLIVEHFTTCGLVGEETNKLVTYIAACSRLLDRPLAIIIQSSSAAGKSSLMDALLRFMPEEMREKYTAVSGKSLFYFDEGTVLKHKILAIVEEEGAEKATYPLKILQSEGELVMASTGKDPATGKLVTKTYRVEGPVMIILTTTDIDIDPELENRCLLLTVDESREHTRAIHELQRMRMTFEGYERKAETERLEKLHRNAQRLLRRINVHNPYAKDLTFVDEQTRTRRDHAKYLSLIETIALMHQYQRPVYRRTINGREEEFVDVTLEDIELAGRLAGEVLGKYLDDLKPQTRTFLLVLHRAVTKLCQEHGVDRSDLRFTRRQIRELTGWTDFQIRVHMARLIELEYVLTHRGSRGQTFVYELLYNGEGADGRPFVLGLVDVERLRDTGTSPASRGRQVEFEPPLSPHRAAIEPTSSPCPMGLPPAPEADLRDSETEDAKNALLPPRAKTYTQALRIRGPRLNLLRFPPRPRQAETHESHSSHTGASDTAPPAKAPAPAPSSATVTPISRPIPKPSRRPVGGRSGRALRRVLPDAIA